MVSGNLSNTVMLMLISSLADLEPSSISISNITSVSTKPKIIIPANKTIEHFELTKKICLPPVQKPPDDKKFGPLKLNFAKDKLNFDVNELRPYMSLRLRKPVDEILAYCYRQSDNNPSNYLIKVRVIFAKRANDSLFGHLQFNHRDKTHIFKDPKFITATKPDQPLIGFA